MVNRAIGRDLTFERFAVLCVFTTWLKVTKHRKSGGWCCLIVAISDQSEAFSSHIGHWLVFSSIALDENACQCDVENRIGNNDVCWKLDEIAISVKFKVALHSDIQKNYLLFAFMVFPSWNVDSWDHLRQRPPLCPPFEHRHQGREVQVRLLQRLKIWI